MYQSRYRPRRRTHPLAAVAGILLLVLVTGGILLAGGAFVGRALVAVTVPEASPPPGLGDRSAIAEATPGPRLTAAPRASSGGEEIGGVEADDPTPTPSITPRPTRTPHPWADLRPRPRSGAFQMSIWEEGAMASQAEAEWCVPAAMLTMINLVRDRRPNTSYAEQDRLYGLARRHSTDRLTGAGAEPEGWAEGLEREGIGPYIVQVEGSRKLAMKEAARALRLTGRPVGILAWRGAHSWVLTGFKATADPAWTKDYEITEVQIADVWWPRVSTIWGASNPPGSWVDVDRLPEDILAWRRPEVSYPEKDGRFVMVLPIRNDGRYDPRRQSAR